MPSGARLVVAPFTGAWIEIYWEQDGSRDIYYVAPFTGAWIEMYLLASGSYDGKTSHPSRVRGLK